jgi:hypothetical protein
MDPLVAIKVHATESPNDFIHEVFDISSNSRNIILQLEDDAGNLSL